MAQEERAFIPFAPPLMGEEEIAELADTLRSGWLTTGPKTERFERELAAYTGAKYGVALNSCTAARSSPLSNDCFACSSVLRIS